MISLIVYIALIGLLTWALTTYIPMQAGFKRVIYIVAIVCIAILVLNAFGLLPIRDVPVPQLGR